MQHLLSADLPHRLSSAVPNHFWDQTSSAFLHLFPPDCSPQGRSDQRTRLSSKPPQFSLQHGIIISLLHVSKCALTRCQYVMSSFSYNFLVKQAMECKRTCNGSAAGKILQFWAVCICGGSGPMHFPPLGLGGPWPRAPSNIFASSTPVNTVVFQLLLHSLRYKTSQTITTWQIQGRWPAFLN